MVNEKKISSINPITSALPTIAESGYPLANAFPNVEVIISTLSYGQMPILDLLDHALLRILGKTYTWNSMIDERLPRLLVLVFSGGSLAVSGVVMQALFQNPLSSPGILGVTSGGSLGVIVVLSTGLISLGFYVIPISAVIGSISSLGLLYLFSRWIGCRGNISMLIFLGIAFSTIFYALESWLTYNIRNEWSIIQTVIEWKSGSTTDKNWHHVNMQMPLLILGMWGIFSLQRELDILSLGEEDAQVLGIEVEKVRWLLFICVALLVGGCLSSVGMIPFFGLVLPHIMRKLMGSNHQVLLKASFLGGSILLTGIDLFFRLFNITGLSVGNFSAIIGAVFFLVLLCQYQKKGYGYVKS